MVFGMTAQSNDRSISKYGHKKAKKLERVTPVICLPPHGHVELNGGIRFVSGDLLDS